MYLGSGYLPLILFYCFLLVYTLTVMFFFFFFIHLFICAYIVWAISPPCPPLPPSPLYPLIFEGTHCQKGEKTLLNRLLFIFL
jgi:hypothetical protein